MNSNKPLLTMIFVSSEVERLRLSLLGCADSKDKDPGEVEKEEKVERGVEEECVYQYNLTLSFESTMGRYLYCINR